MFLSTNENGFWYKDGIIYQVHVKAFYDKNRDGIGDFKGLLEKLDYIQNLGITIIWLLPFYPSPLRDDGYDIADYTSIHPDYGTLDDFAEFLKEAHRRNIKVVTELVLNHTSDQHAWFQKSRRSVPGSQQRDFYVWSDTPEKYKEARIIFQDFESSNWSWDSVAKAYYWHRFYSHQPDLNFDNPLVHKVLLKVVDFWFNMGVDGLRLDAVPYLYEREGTNCENLPETHEFLKKMNAHVNSKFTNKMLLAEANQWPEDAVSYFGNGDECQMAFHFPLMPRIFMSIQMEDRFPIVDILEQTPTIPGSCQWAMFLRNHDELTLEMVTDEERDYMYRFYAREKQARINLGIRRRLAPLVENNRRKIELLNILLFSFPGTPIVYYGDEIGMGDNFYLGDRNGVRTPMQWSFDKNSGFSEANPQKLYLPVVIDPEYHYEAVNVELQQMNPSSLLWWMKKAIAVRKNYSAFGNGTLEFLTPQNPKVLAFLRKYKNEVILVLANLSRYAQAVELDLIQYQGYTPMELFSRNKYPVIKDSLYPVTLNGYDYYWFALQKKSDPKNLRHQTVLPEITYDGNIRNLVETERGTFEKIIFDYLKRVDWLEGSWENITDVILTDTIHLLSEKDNSYLLIIKINYIDRIAEQYLLPLTFCSFDKSKDIFKEHPQSVIVKIKSKNEEILIYDGSFDNEFRLNIIKTLFKKRIIRSKTALLDIDLSNKWKKHFNEGIALEPTMLMKSESKNFSLTYNAKLNLKLYRRLEEGKNPGVEITRILSEKTFFINFPPFIGSIIYKTQNNTFIDLGLISEYVNNQGDCWIFMKDAVKRFFDSILSKNASEKEVLMNSYSDLFSLEHQNTESIFSDNFTDEMIKLMGLRTGELHRELSSVKDDPEFKPEPFTILYQRSIYQSARSIIKNTSRLTRRLSREVPGNLKADLTWFDEHEHEMLNFIRMILNKRFHATKIRIHGNYHLRQILFTGKDFVITNFEGNDSSALSERRLKRSPLRDVSGMIWSLFFAVHFVSEQLTKLSNEDRNFLEKISSEYWKYLCRIFLGSYFDTIKDCHFFPSSGTDLSYLIKFYLVEKIVSEIHNGLTLNADWQGIPIKGIKNFINELSIHPVII